MAMTGGAGRQAQGFAVMLVGWPVPCPSCSRGTSTLRGMGPLGARHYCLLRDGPVGACACTRASFLAWNAWIYRHKACRIPASRCE